MHALRFAAALSLAVVVAAPALAQTADPAAPTVPAPAVAPAPAAYVQIAPAGDTIETLRASGQFKTLLRALEITHMKDVIRGQTSLTLFAPTDAAFAALPPSQLAALMRDPPALQALVTYHLINLPVESARITGVRGPVPTVNSAGLVLDGFTGPGLKANDAQIIQADVRTPNGLIHVVDRVLKPEVGAALTARIAAEKAAAAQAETTPTP
jgi:uncharacterized surface protein with fasciclin (FAS1) repeats